MKITRLTHTVKATDDHQYIFVCDETLPNNWPTIDPKPEPNNQGGVLRIFDISNITSFTPISQQPPYQFLDPIQIYEAPENMNEGRIVSTNDELIYPNNPPNSVHKVFINDNFAYLGYYSKGLRILDISDIENWKETAYYDTPGTANDPDHDWFTGAWAVFPYFGDYHIIVPNYDGLHTFACTPAKPTNFTISGGVGQNPTLSWDANTEYDLDGYNIYIKYGSSAWSLLTSVDEHTTSFIDPGVTITGGKFDPLVCYRITAFNIGEYESDYTLPRCVQSDQLQKPATNKESLEIIDEYSLKESYPNPFNPNAKLTYALPKFSEVEIIIYDELGKKVKTLISSTMNEGIHTTNWDGTNQFGKHVSSGNYFYTFKAKALDGSKETFVKSAKLLLLR